MSPAQSLSAQMQQMCSDWGAYWRAPDAHGVDLTHEQALELLRFSLGVEVAIAAAPAQPAHKVVDFKTEQAIDRAVAQPAPQPLAQCPTCKGRHPQFCSDAFHLCKLPGKRCAELDTPQGEPVAHSELLRLAYAIDPLTRKGLDDLTCAVAAKVLRSLATAQPPDATRRTEQEQNVS